MMDTVQDLLLTIESLPAAERGAAEQRVSEALDLAAPAARAALGLLALDLAGNLTPGEAAAQASASDRQQADIDEPAILVLPDLETRFVSATA